MPALIWIGTEKGGFEGLPDIPGRDLTADEVERFGGTKKLIETGLYKLVDSKPKKKFEQGGPL